MPLHHLKKAVPALLLAATFYVPATPSQALPDDDIYCFEFVNAKGEHETECETVGNLKAECKLTDPGNTSDVCSDVNASRPGRPFLAESLVQDDGSSSAARLSTPSRRR